MGSGRSKPGGSPFRRAVLGGVAGLATAAGAGCVQRARNLVSRRSPRQISLTIKTLPADADVVATTIARQFATNLEAAGIDAEIVLLAEDELYREILINHDFDLYVAQYPGSDDPDFLRPLLHSVFDGEPGWQNPFGFADLEVDELLEHQRTATSVARQDAISELQREIARKQPFTVVALPDEISGVRTDRFAGWRRFPPTSPLRYLALRDRASDGDRPGGDGDPGRLRVTITDDRVTTNLNPIAVEFRNRGTFTGLLYDPLGRRYDGAIRPWLAEDWRWEQPAEDRLVSTVRLREGVTWHDGRPLTAGDVAFTYRFLADTTLGDGDPPVPAPRFRGRISPIDGVERLDDRTVSVAFVATSPDVAARSFEVPILPGHEWRPKSRPANLAGVDFPGRVTEALVWPNAQPVGSGPLRFQRSITEESLLLSRFDGHFLHRDADGADPSRFADGLPVGELNARVTPSDRTAVELLAADEADATATNLAPEVVPFVGRQEQLQLSIAPSRAFYHVGFNARRSPLGNPNFRQLLARLLDKRHVASEVFGGYATPAATPLAETQWVPTDLRWAGGDPVVPFLGSNGDLDVSAARTAFREAGYRYTADGQLVG